MSRLAMLCLVGFVVGCSSRHTMSVPQTSVPTRPWSGGARGPAIAAGQLILKLKPDAGRRVEAARAQGAGPTSTGLPWFDALNRGFRVQRFEPVFPSIPDPDRLRARYPERARRAAGGTASTSLRYVYKLVLPSETDVRQAAAAYRAQPDVEYAEPNYLATIQPAAPRR